MVTPVITYIRRFEIAFRMSNKQKLNPYFVQSALLVTVGKMREEFREEGKTAASMARVGKAACRSVHIMGRGKAACRTWPSSRAVKDRRNFKFTHTCLNPFDGALSDSILIFR